MGRFSVVALMALITACGGSAKTPSAAANRDSAGIAISEYPADAIDKASAWKLSQAPLATIGAEDGDSAIDLSTTMLGTLLPDGRTLVVTMQPSEVLVFDPAGKKTGMIGRGGSGPGEYRFVMQLLRFGQDTVFVFDAGSRKGMTFLASGGPMLGDRAFPVPGDRPIPPLLIGRLDNGVFVHNGAPLIPTPPPGVKGYFRLPMPVLGLRPGATTYDTLFQTVAGLAHASSFEMGDSSIAIGRAVVYGPTTQVAVHGNSIWHSIADRFEVEARDTAGKVTMIIRMDLPARPVTEDAKEKFKVALRDGLNRMKSMIPPPILASELKKVDETVFAENFAGIGQMTVDATGALWVTTGSITDSTTTWAIFDKAGALQGAVVLPEGMLLSVQANRLVLRREDEETGVVRLEVWGLTRSPTPMVGLKP